MMLTVFVIISLVLALFIILPPLWRALPTTGADEASRLRLLYRSRQDELEQDLENQALNPTQPLQARRDLEREMLALIPRESESSPDLRYAGWLKWGVALFMPIVSIGTFLSLDLGARQEVASPIAQVKPADDTVPAAAAMVAQLKQRLQQAPDDVQSWALLGRSYKALGRHAESAEAYGQANSLSAYGDAELVVAYAEALAYSSGRRPDERIDDLVTHALELEPNQPKALWLGGWSRFLRKDYGGALVHWRNLDAQLPADTELKKLVFAHIADAERLQAEQSPQQPVAGQGAGAIDVKVMLAPELQGLVVPEDTIFVFARSPEGLRAPLAVARRQVKDLPFTVRLDDSSAMLPTLKLSDASEIIVTARVSKSGVSAPQTGDLQGVSGAIRVAQGAVEVTIDRRLP